MIKVETNGVEIKKFKKVVIIYNPNSGKQIFVSMLSRVLDLKRRLTAIIGPNRVELTELREFKKLTDWADKIKEEKYDWVIVAGGDGTLRAMIAQLDRNGYVPYISVFPAGTVNLVAKEFDMPADPVRWIQPRKAFPVLFCLCCAKRRTGAQGAFVKQLALQVPR